MDSAVNHRTLKPKITAFHGLRLCQARMQECCPFSSARQSGHSLDATISTGTDAEAFACGPFLIQQMTRGCDIMNILVSWRYIETGAFCLRYCTIAALREPDKMAIGIVVAAGPERCPS